MALSWTEDLSVGIGIIDEQHRTWFDKADQLFEAGKKGQAKEFVGQMLDFLDDYTKKHFSDEEKYMLSINYPEYDRQKNLHTAFIGELAKLKKEFNESGGNILVVLNANQMVVDWLVKHISNEDKKIGAFVKAAK
ncbi:bacteriohemerythrin [Anoxybacterium hadale]|uniref:Bacteriohemerythrin n=1 Tax=Anoxybacterium hadale TaxID=3408580 RepID=A0ACD1A8D0_9FIRM|nr:bacteriohemerythrin [Clostridiales bacterium]